MRLALWAVTFALGIAVGVSAALETPALVALAGAALAVGVAAGRQPGVSGGALAFALGAALGARAQPVPPLAPVVLAAVAAEDAVLVGGRVARGPEWAGRGARLLVDLETV